MKIAKQKCLHFSDIKQGDVFMFEKGYTLYVKIEQARTQPHGILVNMMAVETGCLCCARDDDSVKLVDCELVVK